jgi:hypothetical protein
MVVRREILPDYPNSRTKMIGKLFRHIYLYVETPLLLDSLHIYFDDKTHDIYQDVHLLVSMVAYTAWHE